MEQVSLEAAARTAAGKGAAREARRQGLIPGVVYGLGEEPVVLSVNRDELLHALRLGGGANVLFDLKIAGVDMQTGTVALVKSIQRHPLTRIPESVDFVRVSLADKLHVTVPVVMEGAAPGVKEGGVLDLLLREVEISCLPSAIPQHLVVDVSEIGIHDTRTVASLQVPAGVEVLTSEDAALITCLLPLAAEPETEREGAAAEDEITNVEEAGGQTSERSTSQAR